jgi:ABC-2 type transport system permease protein
VEQEKMTTIYVLWMRQLIRYFRSKSRIIVSLGQPLLYLFVFGFGFGPVFKRAGQGNYIQFLAPGMIGMTILFTSIFSGIELMFDRQFGFLKEMLVSPQPRLLLMLGRTLGGASTSILQGTIVIIICLIAGFRPVSIAALPIAFAFMVLVAVMFAALGTAIACTLTDMQGFQMVVSFLVMPMFFLSGALFPLIGLPSVMVIMAKMDPLTYGVDGIRAAMIGVSRFGMGLDFAVLGVLTVLFLAVGARRFSRIEA